MKTNQITAAANQFQNNDEPILRTLDNADLEKLSGDAADLEIKGVESESTRADNAVSGEGVINIRYIGL
ncbi:MAG: hypothetical protein F6K42_11160 [Leptolyngbya sp. SIO1D8]|nr:hypothetical protein [Leptolyngbya sp. SIO1D8]